MHYCVLCCSQQTQVCFVMAEEDTGEFRIFLEELTCKCTVDDFNLENGLMQATEGPFDGVRIVGVKSIRAINCAAIPVLTIDHRPLENLGLDPVTSMMPDSCRWNYLHEYLQEIGCQEYEPFIAVDQLGRVRINNLPGDTMIEVSGYNTRITRPCFPGLQWWFQ